MIAGGSWEGCWQNYIWVIGSCLIPIPNVKSPIYSAFWHILVFAAPNNYQGDCPPQNPPGHECIYYVLTIWTYFSLLNTYCICLCAAPGFTISAFCSPKLPNPMDFCMCTTAYLKYSGTWLWSKIGKRSVQFLLVRSFLDTIFLYPWTNFPSSSFPHLFPISVSLSYFTLLFHPYFAQSLSLSTSLSYLLLFSFIIFISLSSPSSSPERRVVRQ